MSVPIPSAGELDAAALAQLNGAASGESGPMVVPIAEAPAEFAESGARINRNDVPPAVLALDWLPPDERWPELNELRDTHVRVRESARKAAWAVSGLERKFEAEDEAKADALKAGFAAGVEPDLPEMTSDADRASLLKDARAVAKAATSVSLDHVDKILAFVVERSGDLVSDLAADDRSRDEQIAELEAQLAALRARNNANVRTRLWLDRILEPVAKQLPMFPFMNRWADVPVPHEAHSVEALTNWASSDGMTRRGPVSVINPRRGEDGQPDTIWVAADDPLAKTAGQWPPPQSSDDVTAYDRSGDNNPVHGADPEIDEEGTVELAELPHEDLVDWLLGTGMFDGEKKPTADAVIAAARDGGAGLGERLLKAEAEAHGGTPRQKIAKALKGEEV